MTRRPLATAAELEALESGHKNVVSSTNRLTGLVRLLLCGVICNTIAGALFLGGCIFVVVYVTQSVQIEAVELHGIVHNGFLTSEAIAAASQEVESAVASAAGALNGTSILLEKLNTYLSSPTISIGLGGLGGAH